MLKVDNAAVRAAQIDKLKRLRAERDEAKTQAALDALTEGATRGGNLLELAVKAARAKASVGEISYRARKGVRRATSPRPMSFPASMRARPARTAPRSAASRHDRATSRRTTGRKPRILVAKIGQDGHDRGQKVIASAFADHGLRGGDRRSLRDAGRSGAEGGGGAMCISSASPRMTAGHLDADAGIARRAEARVGREDIMMVVGGVIPAATISRRSTTPAPRRSSRPAPIFPRRRRQLLHELNIRLGFAQREVAKAG